MSKKDKNETVIFPFTLFILGTLLTAYIMYLLLGDKDPLESDKALVAYIQDQKQIEKKNESPNVIKKHETEKLRQIQRSLRLGEPHPKPDKKSEAIKIKFLNEVLLRADLPKDFNYTRWPDKDGVKVLTGYSPHDQAYIAMMTFKGRSRRTSILNKGLDRYKEILKEDIWFKDSPQIFEKIHGTGLNERVLWSKVEGKSRAYRVLYVSGEYNNRHYLLFLTGSPEFMSDNESKITEVYESMHGELEVRK